MRLDHHKGIGEFTYQTELGKSVIDLLICKPSNIASITDFYILPMQYTESDHKPIMFSIELS